jgi:hypothetical protein
MLKVSMSVLQLNDYHLRQVFHPAWATLFSVGTEPLLPLTNFDHFDLGGPEDFKFGFLFTVSTATFLEVVGWRSNGDGDGAGAALFFLFCFGATDRPRDTESSLAAATSFRPIPSVLGPPDIKHFVFF